MKLSKEQKQTLKSIIWLTIQGTCNNIRAYSNNHSKLNKNLKFIERDIYKRILEI